MSHTVPSSNKYILYGFYFVIGLQIFINYFGLLHYYDISNYVDNKNFYTEDIFINKEAENSSLFHLIFFYNLENDLIGILLYSIFTSCAYIYLYKILREYFRLDIYHSLFLLTILGLTSHFLLEEITSAISKFGTGWGSSFGYNLTFPIIYYTLKEKYFHRIFLSIFAILISVKFSFLIIIALLFYTYFKNRNLSNFIYEGCAIVLAILILLIRIDNNNLSNEAGNSFLILKNYIELQGTESFIMMNPKYLIIQFLISFFIFAFLVENLKFEKKVKLFLNFIFYSSIFLVLINILYQNILIHYIQDIRLLIIDVPTYLNYYQIFFIILIFKFLIDKKINFLSVSICFLFIFYWRWSSDTYLMSKFIVLGMLSLFLISIMFNKYFVDVSFFKKKIFLLISSIIILGQFIAINFENRINKFSYQSFKMIGKFYTNIKKNEDLVEHLISLRNCDDFTLLYMENNGKNRGYYMNLEANLLSKKSRFVNNDCRVFSEKILRECNLRRKFLYRIINSSIKIDDVAELKNLNLVIYSEKKLKKNFSFNFEKNINFNSVEYNLYSQSINLISKCLDKI